MRRHPLLLEISAWPWLERLSHEERRVVTLATVPAKRWDRIADDGFDALFLMGVWRRSAIGRDIARSDRGLVAEYDRILPDWTEADVPGSPYCIQAYEPDARMGGWPGLDTARHELESRGISLILDFVPNHTGFDHAWIAEHPERYVLGTDEDYRIAPADFRLVDLRGVPVPIACGRDPYFAPWTDVAQLNYFNPDTRLAMQATLRDIAAHCDGVRCDMAMLVLNDVFDRTWRRLLRDGSPPLATEFWSDITGMIPGLVYLAEVYWGLEGVLLEQGFTFAYDKRLLDGLHSPDRAARTRDLLSASLPDPTCLSRFLENHDEARSAATLRNHLPAAASLLASLPGMRFFFDGQLEGRRIKAPVQLGRWPEEPADEAVRALYERALAFSRARVLHEGEWKLLTVSTAGDPSFADIIAYRWRSADSLAVVVVNLGAATVQAHVAIGQDLFPGGAFDFDDRLTDATYRWTRDALLDRGLYVRLEVGRAHLFHVRVRPEPDLDPPRLQTE
jgi:alpha amylase-like protein